MQPLCEVSRSSILKGPLQFCLQRNPTTKVYFPIARARKERVAHSCGMKQVVGPLK